MSEYAEGPRKAMKEKAHRLANADPHQKVDASSWTPPEPLNAGAKTGMRPISKQNLKCGGAAQAPNAGRKPRKSGGRSLANDLVNRNDKAANAERDGPKHEGGMKTGGRAKRAGGGLLKEALGHGFLGLAGLGISHLMGGDDEDKPTATAAPKKRGGRAYKDVGGPLAPPLAAGMNGQGRMAFNFPMRKRGGRSVSNGEIEGTRPTGGREARACGGKTKGKTQVNVIIAQPSTPPTPDIGAPAPAAPMPLPPIRPPGMPAGVAAAPPMPAGPPGGAPMPRKRGGRAHDAGAGSGEGRLEKVRDYGKRAHDLDGHY